jgi:hypothetical protein
MKNCISRGILLVVSVGIMLLFSGCTNYYMVTDPHSGNVYYTTEIEEPKGGGGAVKLRDERTGNTVTIQNSEVKEISKDEFNVGVYPPPPADDEKKAE